MHILKVKKACKENGFTLMELIIASGIFSVFTLALSSSLLYFGGSIRKVQYDIDMEQHFHLIRRLLKEDKAACTNTLSNTSINNGVVEDIKNKNNDVLIKTDDSTSLIKKNVILNKMFINNYETFDSSTGSVELNIEYIENKGSQDNEKKHTKIIQRLYVNTAQDAIKECVALIDSPCDPKELTLAISQREFGVFTKYSHNTSKSQRSGEEIISTFSRKGEHCVSHAICYEGKWQNLSFCKDSQLSQNQNNNPWWASDKSFQKDWNGIIGNEMSEEQKEIVSCDDFKKTLNCKDCRDHPLTFPSEKAGTSVHRFGKTINHRKCGEDSKYAYYYKNFRCSDFGEWQWDKLSCGRLLVPGELLPFEGTILKDDSGEPLILSQEEQDGVCEPSQVSFPVPLPPNKSEFNASFYIADSISQGRTLIARESNRTWILVCKERCNSSNNCTYKYEAINLAILAAPPEKPETPKLDILLIVDNSGSMQKEQEKLSVNIDSFIDTFFQKANKIDFRLAVYTTGRRDLIEKRLHEPISSESVESWGANAEKNRLKTALIAGTDGPLNEYPVEAANEILKSFFTRRQSAFLNLIFITDAGVQLKDADRRFKESFQGKNVILQGAVYTGNDSCGKDGGPHNDFPALRKLIHSYRTGKEDNVFDICSDNYGNELAKFASNVISRISVQSYSPDSKKQ